MNFVSSSTAQRSSVALFFVIGAYQHIRSAQFLGVLCGLWENRSSRAVVTQQQEPTSLYIQTNTAVGSDGTREAPSRHAVRSGRVHSLGGGGRGVRGLISIM